jgi:hypothetical protein
LVARWYIYGPQLSHQLLGNDQGLFGTLPKECGIEDDEELNIEERTLHISR